MGTQVFLKFLDNAFGPHFIKSALSTVLWKLKLRLFVENFVEKQNDTAFPAKANTTTM